MCLLIYGDNMPKQTLAPCNWQELIMCNDKRIYQFTEPIFAGQRFEFFCNGHILGGYYKNIFGFIVPVYNDLYMYGNMMWHKIIASQSMSNSDGHVLWQIQITMPDQIPAYVDRYWLNGKHTNRDNWLMQAALETNDIGYINSY